jgi:hypothetical protein
VKDAITAGAPSEALSAPVVVPPVVASAQLVDTGADVPASLPRDHPAWQRDVLSVSARVRAIVAALRPVALRVLTFWDHAVRSIGVRGRRVEVDPSGCYRLR